MPTWAIRPGLEGQGRGRRKRAETEQVVTIVQERKRAGSCWANQRGSRTTVVANYSTAPKERQAVDKDMAVWR